MIIPMKYLQQNCHMHFLYVVEYHTQGNQGANTLHDLAYIPFAMLFFVYYKNMPSCPNYSDQETVTCKLLASIIQIWRQVFVESAVPLKSSSKKEGET